MSERDKKVPDLWLEQAALGELDATTRAALEARLGPDELQAHNAALTESNQEILEALPSRRVVSAIQRRAQRAKRQDRSHQWMSVAWSAATVLSLAALLVVLYDDFSTDARVISEREVEVTRSKGIAPHLVVYRKRGDAAERLHEGAKVAAGDVLQVAYVSARQRYGAVVSVDGAGAVTLHLPLAGQSAALQNQGETLLGEAYKLDAAPRFERFFFVTAEHAFDVALVEQAARALVHNDNVRQGTLPLPADVKQTSFTVIKVQP